jgi:hypothetical protein
MAISVSGNSSIHTCGLFTLEIHKPFNMIIVSEVL